ncbi:MAG: hypothetical protein Q8N96_05775 [Methylovulum sp.]|nr:hypothetical protein [Methylovulum sp.]
MSGLIYVLACFIIACFGIKRKLGFWGYFFGSLFLTPFVGIILVAASGKPFKEGWWGKDRRSL